MKTREEKKTWARYCGKVELIFDTAGAAVSDLKQNSETAGPGSP